MTGPDTIVCSKCGAPMVLKERLVFPGGPAKLVYECTANPNHVTVMDAAAAPTELAGAATPPGRPVDLSKELGNARPTQLLLSPDHSMLTIESDCGDRLVVTAREGGKLKVELVPKPADD
ncbi:MAG TPA: hypothetical protein V6D05_04495 [Stenomitos sp.]